VQKSVTRHATVGDVTCLYEAELSVGSLA